jgi:hypothetical protein
MIGYRPCATSCPLLVVAEIVFFIDGAKTDKTRNNYRLIVYIRSTLTSI